MRIAQLTPGTKIGRRKNGDAQSLTVIRVYQTGGYSTSRRAVWRALCRNERTGREIVLKSLTGCQIDIPPGSQVVISGTTNTPELEPITVIVSQP